MGYATIWPGPWYVTSPPRSMPITSTSPGTSTLASASRLRPSVNTWGCSTSSSVSGTAPCWRCSTSASWRAHVSRNGSVPRSMTRRARIDLSIPWIARDDDRRHPLCTTVRRWGETTPFVGGTAAIPVDHSVGGPRPSAVDDVNGFAHRRGGGFHHRLRQRRVRMDREPEIVGDGAHLDRERGLGDQ